MIDLSTIDDALTAFAILKGNGDTKRWDRAMRLLNIERAEMLKLGRADILKRERQDEPTPIGRARK